MTKNSPPPIDHELINPDLADLIDLPDARLIETIGLHGITQLQAVKVEPVFQEENGRKMFDSWQQIGDYQFKMMISPNQSIIRLELYDPLMFSILLEQLIQAGYHVISSGEDVEFTADPRANGGWLGWAHLSRSSSLAL